MAKDPAFLFYSSDFLSGVTDLTMEERGQYITLLCLQHQKGHLPEKTIRLSVGSVSIDVLKKFITDQSGSFYNERLDIEIQKRIEFTESRRLNGSKGGRPKASAEPSGYPSAKPLGYPTEKLAENENIDGINTFNSSFSKILNKKYEAGPKRGMTGIGQDVDSLVIQMRSAKMSDDEIMDQAKSMRSYYDLKEWPMPTNYIKLLSALTENDWPQKLKDEDPEKKSERITKSLKDASRKQPEPDTIGSSEPGSLG